MHFYVAEQMHPPRKPERSDYDSSAKYLDALSRYSIQTSYLVEPYLPPDVPAVIIIALNESWLPDFQIVDDAQSKGSN
jgi:hypothetical protein